ncbi:MFS transporter [Thiomonas sp. 13-64-67]|uniref:MFS transporter n=1 Tax=Thiomonas sp. 13-64-67 TaxID=1970447 RepID=UPI000BD649C2|nr:MFS transporter [Thiomonas sp. 13-64-67]OZB70068.1 MAG: MFS transporter [Thiomonas sp. 13-64-67]
MASIAMGAKARPMTAGEKKVIFASSLGTVFEWYDFYLYGSLAAIIAKQFFAGLDAGSAFIFALLAFAAGFIVRPFGALLFGRLGDMIGRKYTFLVTILIMGLSTFIVGVLPNYAAIGAAAPVILIALRLLQGLALGGEYGGAATYVAEHAPANKRGAYTSWIQTTATLGLFLSLLVILGTRTLLGEDAFNAWGWRVPFLVSIALLAVSVWIRLKLNESPAFIKMKADGKASKAPLTEAFARWGNLKYVILALLGRKPIILAGCAIAALTYFPLFQALTHYANPALYRAVQNSPVTLTVDQSQCTFQFNPTGTAKFTSSCDIAKQMLAANSANYNTVSGTGPAVIQIGDKTITVVGAKDLPPDEFKAKEAALKKEIGAALKAAGYPAKADPAQMNLPMVIAILALLVIFVTMVYGPIAAALVELFPTRIRYTSMSLPYHIGNGWFGGLLPTIAFALVAQNGNIYYGLWYPVIIAAGTFVIGLFFLPETKDRDIYAAD